MAQSKSTDCQNIQTSALSRYKEKYMKSPLSLVAILLSVVAIVLSIALSIALLIVAIQINNRMNSLERTNTAGGIDYENLISVLQAAQNNSTSLEVMITLENNFKDMIMANLTDLIFSTRDTIMSQVDGLRMNLTTSSTEFKNVMSKVNALQMNLTNLTSSNTNFKNWIVPRVNALQMNQTDLASSSMEFKNLIVPQVNALQMNLSSLASSSMEFKNIIEAMVNELQANLSRINALQTNLINALHSNVTELMSRDEMVQDLRDNYENTLLRVQALETLTKNSRNFENEIEPRVDTLEKKVNSANTQIITPTRLLINVVAVVIVVYLFQ